MYVYVRRALKAESERPIPLEIVERYLTEYDVLLLQAGRPVRCVQHDGSEVWFTPVFSSQQPQPRRT